MKSKKWQELLKQTSKLTQPGMVKAILSERECKVLLALIAESTANFAKANKPFNVLKIFKDGLQDNAQNEKFVNDPPQESESLVTWAERFYQGEPFGFIMNFLEDYNNDVVEEMAKHVAPLLEKHGTPWAGLLMLFFMGDYGYTPFGVHRGSPGEDGVLFHLGPATKIFYIWETEEYNRLTNNASSYHKVEEILHAATPYILEPGDAISFPDDMYHVANTEEFSVSLVLDYRRAAKTSVKELIINELSNVNLNKNELLGHLSEENILQTLNFHSECEVAVHRIKLKLESNGGFSTKSKIKPFNLDLEGVYSLKTPFTLTLLPKEANQLSVFSRGHEITTQQNDLILEVIDNLNSGIQVNISALNIELIPETKGFSLCELLMKVGETGILRKV